ncbi:hypothetical protein GRI58_01265 [Porphyrobacter algicida]|uniref:Uncharacterized protein n=1 Tax=Qipengyuania algicida TaxID=1836209 RepID=A0A845AB33_9SPHN|nr:hypothetical protein [Qipengyuania algicida]MXP27450.1 hypothetical protein [Qipengyuania algicida]
MSLVLMAVLLSDLGPAKQIEMLKVPSEVYWASYRASGAKLCNHNLRENQERRFDKRFGRRVSKLISAIAAKGDKKSQDDELIVPSGCIAYRDRQAVRKGLSRTLDDFEPILVEMKRRYGISEQ